jgi:hypothetical protein
MECAICFNVFFCPALKSTSSLRYHYVPYFSFWHAHLQSKVQRPKSKVRTPQFRFPPRGLRFQLSVFCFSPQLSSLTPDSAFRFQVSSFSFSPAPSVFICVNLWLSRFPFLLSTFCFSSAVVRGLSRRVANAKPAINASGEPDAPAKDRLR